MQVSAKKESSIETQIDACLFGGEEDLSTMADLFRKAVDAYDQQPSHHLGKKVSALASRIVIALNGWDLETSRYTDQLFNETVALGKKIEEESSVFEAEQVELQEEGKQAVKCMDHFDEALKEFNNRHVLPQQAAGSWHQRISEQNNAQYRALADILGFGVNFISNAVSGAVKGGCKTSETTRKFCDATFELIQETGLPDVVEKVVKSLHLDEKNQPLIQQLKRFGVTPKEAEKFSCRSSEIAMTLFTGGPFSKTVFGGVIAAEGVKTIKQLRRVKRSVTERRGTKQRSREVSEAYKQWIRKEKELIGTYKTVSSPLNLSEFSNSWAFFRESAMHQFKRKKMQGCLVHKKTGQTLVVYIGMDAPNQKIADLLNTHRTISSKKLVDSKANVHHAEKINILADEAIELAKKQGAKEIAFVWNHRTTALAATLKEKKINPIAMGTLKKSTAEVPYTTMKIKVGS